MAERHHADAVLIEDVGSGIALIQDLQEDGIARPIGITPEKDKGTRIIQPRLRSSSPRYRGGAAATLAPGGWRVAVCRPKGSRPQPPP